MIILLDQAQLAMATVILDTIYQTRQSLEEDADPSFATAIGIFFKVKLWRDKHDGALCFRFKSKLFHSIRQVDSSYFFPDEANRNHKAVINEIAFMIALTEYAEAGGVKFVFATGTTAEHSRFFPADFSMYPFSEN
jgi:hypothetical protein